MRSTLLAPLLALGLTLSAAADTPEPLAPADASPPAPDAVAPRARATSPTTSARVAGALPKFAPRPAAPADATSSPPVDLREVDRPRNTILRLPRSLLPPAAYATASAVNVSDEPPPEGVTRLPRYEVRDRKYPALKNRELLTPEAKIDLQFKKHPALRIGNLFGLNRGIAAVMAAEDDAYERRQEMAELLSFQRFADAHPARDPDDPATPASAGTTK